MVWILKNFCLWHRHINRINFIWYGQWTHACVASASVCIFWTYYYSKHMSWAYQSGQAVKAGFYIKFVLIVKNIILHLCTMTQIKCYNRIPVKIIWPAIAPFLSRTELLLSISLKLEIWLIFFFCCYCQFHGNS